ncbi:hypothetical protein DRO22_01985 [Candidatus Bathyarchaeota archaeon]|nr:MAG: hypothetical protein DRO22_01985 [Candidatus Bathyarchaeota archaeon]
MKSKVAIVRDADIEERTRRAVDLIGGMEKAVGRGDKVLVKPNMVGGFPSETGETTDPEFVRVIVEMAFEAGAKEVLVGEGEPFVSMEELKRRFVNRAIPSTEPLHTRYKRILKKTGGKLIDFNADRWETVKVPNPVFFDKIQVARAVLDCDVLIGAPVLKTHHLAGITVALKNLYGVIPRSDKGRYHRLDRVEEAIIDINKVRTCDMVIVDGTRTILHWGRIDEYLETKQLNLTLAGFDPVAIDAVSAKILGINPESLRFLIWAEEHKLGTADLNRIETVGITIEEAYEGKMMTSVEYVNRKLSKIHLLNCGACTGCFGRIATALNRIDDSGMKEDAYIFMGPDVGSIKEKGKVFLCGNCAAPTIYNKRKGIFIPGCPPDLRPLLDEIKKIGALIK